MRFRLPMFTALVCSSVLAIQDVPREDLWIAGGTVNAMRVKDGILYIGGSIDYVGPRNGPGVVCSTTGTGSVKPGPLFYGPSTYGCESDGSGGWYISGMVNDSGIVSTGVFRVLPDGRRDSTFDSPPSCYGLEMAGGVLYASTIHPSIKGIIALDPTTGARLPWQIPITSTSNSTDFIKHITVCGDTMFIAGEFTDVAGEPRSQVAAIDIPTQMVKPWVPDLKRGTNPGLVSAITAGNGVVYVGGSFDNAEGEARNGLAAYETTTWSLTPWNPAIVSSSSPAVSALLLDGTTLYVGGSFTQMGGATRTNLAALDTLTGAATAWNPSGVPSVGKFDLSGSTLYVATSTFSGFPLGFRGRIQGYSTVTGNAAAFGVDATSGITSLRAHGESLCVVGTVASVGGAPRNGLAALDLSTGAATSWAPTATATTVALEVIDNVVYAPTATGMRAYARDTGNVVTLPAAYNASGVKSLLANGSTLYAVGSFATFGGAARSGFAAVDTSTNTVLPLSFNIDGPVHAIDISGSNIYLGGAFTAINSQARSCVAAVDTTGNLLNLAPAIFGTSPVVNAIHVKDDLLFFGGNFSSVNSTSRSNFAGIHLDSIPAIYGTLWSSSIAITNIIDCITSAGDFVYAGSKNGSTSLAYEFSLSSSARTRWDPLVAGVQSMVIFGNTLITGGRVAFSRHSPAQFSFDVPQPALRFVVPAELYVNERPPNNTLTIIGNGLYSGSNVEWNGTPLVPIPDSQYRMFLFLSAADVATAGIVNIRVVNPDPGGASNTVTLQIKNRPPLANVITPNSVERGADAFTLSVTGDRFVSTSVVRFNGTDLATTLVSATELSAIVPAPLVENGGIANATVFSPSPGGGETAPLTFTITRRSPTLNWNAPALIVAGTPLGAAQLSASCNLPGALTYTPPAGTLLAPGMHTLRVAFTPANSNNDDAGDASVAITVANDQPQMLSQPAAVPNPAFAGDQISFTGAASDYSSLTYVWTFPDGTTATGESMMHTFTAAGVYVVNLVVNDSMSGTVASSVTVVVSERAEPPGAGVETPGDKDGDGVPDEVEIQLGTNPADGASSPIGGPIRTLLPLTVIKARVLLSFKDVNSDSLQIDARVALPQALDIVGLPVVADVGGIVRMAPLNSRGHGTVAGGGLKLRVVRQKRGHDTAHGIISLRLTRSALQARFVDEGLTVAGAAGTYPLKVSFYLGDTRYSGMLPLLYSVKHDKGTGR